MKTESLQLLEHYLAGQLSEAEARSAERLLGCGDTAAGRGEDLAVYTFLRELGPSEPPPSLVERTCRRLRAEAAGERSRQTAWSAARSIGTALSWSYRGPALAMAGPWSANATHFSVQGLGMSRFALGPLGLAPLGLARSAQPKPRTPVWRRLLQSVRAS
ncbi:MAG: hypothetical protein JW940_33085 [Polyangiaceae bacterium]|nr:hypothetical protein [Polyangiaceae bacterium]